MGKDVREHVSLEQSLAAHGQVIAQFGSSPVIKPGKIELLGWNLEYVCGPALASFIDQILVRKLNDFVPDNDHPVILDCGANIGFSVLNYKRQFPKARITAFEPDPQFLPILRRNLQQNGASDVEIVDAAAWTQKGKVSWLCEGIDGSKIVDSRHKARNTITVQAVDLSAYVKQPVDLLKLDIEGAEYRVVAHLRHKLGKVQNVLIECHLDQSTIVAFGEMLKVLIEEGFNVSMNSFGSWRDLIRQSPIELNHWEQYLLVAAWRKTKPALQTEDALMPYIGAQLASELFGLRARAQNHHQRSLEAASTWIESLVTGKRKAGSRRLKAPFIHDGGCCWIAPVPTLEIDTDNEAHPVCSHLLVLENEQLLGPPHCLHAEIRESGRGRFSHWKQNVYFSTSDDSDPNANGRRYTIVYY